MKVIDKSNREILLEFLKLPDDIREYDINKQYTILHDKIEVLEKSIFLDDSIIEHNDYTPSNRQDATWQNALRNFQAKDYLNAYFEIFDYIDDYGNRENRNLFESEMNNIKSIFRGINKKIQEIINFDNEKEEIKLLDKDDNTNTNMDKDDINKKYKGISGIISVKNILGFLPKQNDETGNVINKKININLPHEFQPMKSMPEDPKDSVVYGKQTSSATCIAMLYYINKEDAMPYNNEKIINGIHNTLGDDQGLIEVNSGSTKNNKKYVYSIVKTRKEPSGIQYTLTFQIEMQEGILNIQAFFDEIGVTGQRESIIMAKMINEGKINPNEMNAWTKDPYDETYNKGLRMNLAEKEEYDVVFPEHPLSEARNLVKIIIEKN